jgi:transcription initiation factor TFIIIB Brf1 subunit/transcription initiation factor TFIIB
MMAEKSPTPAPPEASCLHHKIYEVLDTHTNDVICSNCGTIIGIEFQQQQQHHQHQQQDDEPSCAEKPDIENIIDRLHLPESFVKYVTDDYIKHYRDKKHVNTIKRISSCIYSSVNRINNCVSINDISRISGVPASCIKDKRTIHELDVLSNKYLAKFNIPFKEQSLIKDLIKKEYEHSGHNPLTIIASIIYMHCKRKHNTQSMSYVANIFGISPISIRRFINKQHL